MQGNAYDFLIPLIAGFISNLASAFTTFYSGKWGKRTGTVITFLLRNIFGIPVWAAGYVLAVWDTNDLLFQSSLLTEIAGWSVICAGGIIIVIALASIRFKAAAPAMGNQLVHTGLYAWVRHPIHSGTALEFIGLFILWPSINVGVASLIGFGWIYLQSGFEEKDLVKRIPEYGDYMKRVPRFVPGLRGLV